LKEKSEASIVEGDEDEEGEEDEKKKIKENRL